MPMMLWWSHKTWTGFNTLWTSWSASSKGMALRTTFPSHVKWHFNPAYYFRSWLLTCLFVLIVSAFIDPKTCPRVWLQIVCGTYPKKTCVFTSPSGLWKVLTRVPVGCSELFAPIDFFTLSILSFKYFFKPSFVECWLVCIIFIVSVFIDPETCPRVWLQIFSEPYQNWTYIFASPAGLWEVVVMVPIFCDFTCWHQ